MILFIAISTIIILLFAIMLRPFWGMLLLWPVLLCYPYTITENLLPFNVGINDIFIVFVFVTIVLRKQLLGQPFRFGKWGFLLCGFFALYVASTLYGASVANLPAAQILQVLMKSIVKRSEYVFIGLSVINVVEDTKQVQKLIKWFLIGCIGLSIISILQYFMPQTVAIFYRLEDVTAGMEVFRATGSTRGPWELGGLLGAAIIISCGLLIMGKGIFSKGIPLTCAMLSVPAIILSTSRAGWLFVVIGVMVLLFMSKKPLMGIIVILVVASILLIFPFFTEKITDRIEYTGGLTHLDSASMDRLDIWHRILSNLDISMFFLGLGSVGAFLKYESTPHNFYLTILTHYGIVGLFFFIAFFISLWRHTWNNIRFETDQTLMAVWKAIFAMNVGVLAYSLTTDTLETDIVGAMLIFLWSLLYVRDSLDEQVDSGSLFNCEVPDVNGFYEKPV